MCETNGLALIEDACHAVGGRYIDSLRRAPHGLHAGNLGDLACFSFFSNKNMATGEGGMITTNRDDLNQRLRLLRSHGMSTLTWDRHRGHASSYEVSTHGFNYRLDEIHAALGRCQLARLQGNTGRRKKLAAAYHSQLTDLPGWVIPFAGYPGESAYHLMIAVAPNVELREEAAVRLRSAGIQTSLHYPFIPAFKAFARFPAPQLETSRSFAQRTITLPLFPTMTLEQVDAVCANLRGVALRRASRAAL
jgi:dTDP-4-amino-4,6-dideoxygalactose transaminase